MGRPRSDQMASWRIVGTDARGETRLVTLAFSYPDATRKGLDALKEVEDAKELHYVIEKWQGVPYAGQWVRVKDWFPFGGRWKAETQEIGGGA